MPKQKCKVEIRGKTAVCVVHGKKLVCPSEQRIAANRAWQDKYDEKTKAKWRRKGGRLGGRPKKERKDVLEKPGHGEDRAAAAT